MEKYLDLKERLEEKIITSTDEKELTEIYEFIKNSDEEDLDASKIYYLGFLVSNDSLSGEIIEEIYLEYKEVIDNDYEFFECFVQNCFTNIKSYILEELFEDMRDFIEKEIKKFLKKKKELILDNLLTDIEYFVYHKNSSDKLKKELLNYLKQIEELKKSIKSKRINTVNECIKFLLINYIPCEYDYEIFGEHSCDKTKEFYSKSI